MGSETKREPIFIFGSARSGTSLLSRIIDTHPAIGVPFESLLYATFYPIVAHYGDLTDRKNRERLVDDILFTDPLRRWTPVPDRDRVLHHFRRHDFHGAFDAVMNAWLESQGKVRWGEKTPHHAYFWRDILEAFPGAKMIHIVRDGRDTAISWKKARFGPRHYYPLAHRWVDYLNTIEELRRHVDTSVLHEIRYEDLLADPEPVVQGICSFLGVDCVPQMLEFYKNDTPYPTDARNNTNLSKPLMRSNTQKWRTKMSGRDLRIFEAVAGPTLERFGYERGCPGASLSNREVLQIRFLENPPARLYGMMKNVRGYVEVARLFKIYAGLFITNTKRKWRVKASG